MCETDGWRETRQIAKLTDNFFSWPLYAVLSSRPHLALLPHLGRGCSSRGSWGLLPSAVRSHWLQAGSDSGLHSSNFNCHGHLHILFHNAHLLPIRFRDLLPLIYTRCVSEWQLGKGSICNTGYDTKLNMILRLQFCRSEMCGEPLYWH